MNRPNKHYNLGNIRTKRHEKTTRDDKGVMRENRK